LCVDILWTGGEQYRGWAAAVSYQGHDTHIRSNAQTTFHH